MSQPNKEEQLNKSMWCLKAQYFTVYRAEPSFSSALLPLNLSFSVVSLTQGKPVNFLDERMWGHSAKHAAPEDKLPTDLGSCLFHKTQGASI